jgi:hypothetical protein
LNYFNDIEQIVKQVFGDNRNPQSGVSVGDFDYTGMVILYDMRNRLCSDLQK